MTFHPAKYPMPDWTGETVFILGGGPSLKGFDPRRLRGHKVIGVNEAGLSLCPWADILFWADMRWIQWNAPRLHLHTGEYRYTCQLAGLTEDMRARYIEWKPRITDEPNLKWNAFDLDPEKVAGFDGGSRCINLAYHTGAERVVLLGFDMHDLPMTSWRDGNFHSEHAEPPLEGQRAEKFIPAHDRMATEIERLRESDEGFTFEVLNATPNSALRCWPRVKLENVL